MVGAEVGVDHGLVLADGLGRALGDDAALGHHHHPVADARHDVHVVLDEEHRGTVGAHLLDVLEQGLREGRVHAGHGLVEHDHARLAHEGPGHLEQLALAAGQGAGELVAHVVHLEALEQVVGPLLDLALLAPPDAGDKGPEEVLSPLAGCGQLHVLDDRELGQRLGELEGAHHAGFRELVGRRLGQRRALEAPLPLVGVAEAGEAVEERGLARTVGPDEGGDGAALHFEVVDVDGGEATEPAGHAVGHEDGIGLGDAGLSGDVLQDRSHAGGVGGGVVGRVTHRGPAPACCRRCPVVGRPSAPPGRRRRA